MHAWCMVRPRIGGGSTEACQSFVRTMLTPRMKPALSPAWPAWARTPMRPSTRKMILFHARALLASQAVQVTYDREMASPAPPSSARGESCSLCPGVCRCAGSRGQSGREALVVRDEREDRLGTHGREGSHRLRSHKPQREAVRRVGSRGRESPGG
jgi:hypothetical protein